MIAALTAAHVPVTAFVNAVNVKDRRHAEALREWRTGGFTLGNHTWSHPHLSDLTIAQFESELTKDEPMLSKLGAGTDWRWFRYPFLDEGKDAVQRIGARRVLAKHGYRVAAVTMSFSDWACTGAYARCSAAARHAQIAELERLYLQSAQGESCGEPRQCAQALWARHSLRAADACQRHERADDAAGDPSCIAKPGSGS